MGFTNDIHLMAGSAPVWPGVDAIAAERRLRIDEVRNHLHSYFANIRQRFGRDAVRLCFAIYGTGATFDDLAAVRRHLPALQAREREAANLLPLFGATLRFDRVPDNLAVFRNRALAGGMTPAGWRWVTRQSRAVVRALIANRFNPGTFAWVNLLAASGEELRPPMVLPGKVAGLEGLDDFAQGALSQPDAYRPAANALTAFLRIALREYARRTAAADRQGFFMEYDALVHELERALRKGETMIQDNSTWGSLWRGFERRMAQREALAREAAANADAELRRDGQHRVWRSLLPAQSVQGVQVTPLCSHSDLVAEGVMLSHCVGEGLYSELCMTGECRIFSLRGAHSNLRATLQLRNVDGTWIVGQMRSFGNSNPPGAFMQVARTVCELYNAAQKAMGG